MTHTWTGLMAAALTIALGALALVAVALVRRWRHPPRFTCRCGSTRTDWPGQFRGCCHRLLSGR